MKDNKELENILGVKFTNQECLSQALVHRSYLNEHHGFSLEHNERLEFLGDAVLELSVTEHLYRDFKNAEGELTLWRAALVNTKMLANVAGRLGIEKFLMLSQGEAKDTGRARESILANALEAIIGAIYLDQGYRAAKNFIRENILPELPKILENHLFIDAKSRFQELAQEKFSITPHYEALEEYGPDHDKTFVVGVYLKHELVAKGKGANKQEAEQVAARVANDKCFTGKSY